LIGGQPVTRSNTYTRAHAVAQLLASMAGSDG
jgi:hypothetical protein